MATSHPDANEVRATLRCERAALPYERACPSCQRSFAELDPRLFSYTSRHGWCTDCELPRYLHPTIVVTCFVASEDRLLWADHLLYGDPTWRIEPPRNLSFDDMDVLDGLDTVKICVGYKVGDEVFDVPPMRVEQYEDCEPVYEEMPGWDGSTAGVTDLNAIPEAAQTYLKRIEEILQVPIDLISTGPERDETIILKHPFD